MGSSGLKKAIGRADLGILLVLASCILAVYPFVSRPGLPVETDAELHVIRTAELSRLLQGGELYPRWAPDFYFGYGYPIFNYYAPLSYYIAAGLALAFGVSVVVAVKLVFVAAVLAAGLGMYCLTRARWGVRSGVVAAAVYVYSPYVHYIDPYARGVLAESLGLALLPWTMWAFYSLAHDCRERPGLTITRAAVLLAALICAHNLVGITSCLILGMWICWRWVESLLSRRLGATHDRDRPLAPRTTAFLVSAAALGVALSAFFWLPLVAERGAVQYGNLVSAGGHYDFRNHFLSPSELLRPTGYLDLGATEPRFLFNLGVVQWISALLGALSLLSRRTPARSLGLFWALLALALVVLVLPVSEPIWETLPFMSFLQFPWRLLGPLAASLAVLAAISVSSLETHVTQKVAEWVASGTVALVLVTALPLTYPPEWPAEFGRTDPWGILEHELDGRWLGTTSTGDYVPSDVVVVPRPIEQLLDSYQAGGPPDRVNRATLPSGTSVDLVSDTERELVWHYRITGLRPFVFRIFHFYFPGWTASLDDQPVAIELAKPEGFMTVDVPAGSHELVFAFRDTPVRSFAWILSGAALLTCLTISLSKLPPGFGAKQTRPSVSPLFFLVPAAVLLLKIAFADPLGWFRLESEGLVVRGAEHQVYYELGHEIALIAFDWNPGTPGKAADLVLYWKALRPVATNYQVFAHLRNEEGAVVAQSDRLNPGDYPTERWPLDKYVRDQHVISIPGALPPGKYQLAVGLWTMADSTRLQVQDAAGEQLGDSIVLERLVVK